MEQYKSEYEKFGPWAYEVRSVDEVPRLFQGYYSGWEKHLMMIKIPCKIDRRDAHPGMDLYDYLIGAYDTCLRILIRYGWSVVEQRIDYQNIIAIKDTRTLLMGQLTLFTPLGPVVIGYNTVSEDIINKLVKIIEDKVCGSAQCVGQNIPILYESGGWLDMLFYSLISKLIILHPDLRLAAYQPKIIVRYTCELIKKLNYGRHPISQTAFIIRSGQLIVLEKRQPTGKSDIETYEYSFLYIPLNNISSTRLIELDFEQSLSLIEITVRNLTFHYAFDNRNISIVNLHRALCQMNNA